MTIRQDDFNWKPPSSSSSRPKKKTQKSSNKQVSDIKWCWKESKGKMERHSPDTVHGNDKSKCLILYPKDVALQIESAREAEYTEFHLPATGTRATTQYMIDFNAMEQVNLRTGYRRKVKRIARSKSAKKKQKKNGPTPSAGTIAVDQSLRVSPLPTVTSSLCEFTTTNVSTDMTKQIMQDVEECQSKNWWDIYSDLADVPAYTCACQFHCKRLVQASPGTAAVSDGQVNSTDKVGEACNRRSRCTKCQMYPHADCLKPFFGSNNEEEKLCHTCFDNSSSRSCIYLCTCCFLVGCFFLLALHLWLVVFLPPILIESAFFRLPQTKKILDEYLEKGIKIDGIVTRRWCHETSDGDGGTRKTYHCSIVYNFPNEKADDLYRLDVMKMHRIPRQEWDQMYYKGAMVQIMALEGYPKSGRIAHTVKPWTSRGLKVRICFAIKFSIAWMLIPSLLVLFGEQLFPESTYLQENRWPSICVYCLLGFQLVLCVLHFTLFRYKKSRKEWRLNFINSCSIKPGDLPGPGMKTGSLRHEGEDY